MRAQRLLVSMFAGLTAVAATQAPVHAQSRDEGVLEEIVVTAQKIEQNIIDVPISMTVLGVEELEALRVQGVEDYALVLPNVVYVKSSRDAGASLSIRGVSGETGGSFSPINVTVDEMPLSTIDNKLILGLRSLDLERVEVLRGPQGTLTGANALGGIVNLITTKPQTEAVSAKAALDYGRFNTWLAKASLNTPVSDSLAILTTAFWESSDGATENVGPAGGSSSADNYGGRVSARWLASDRLTFDASITHERQDYGLNSFAYIDQYDDGPNETSERRQFVIDFYDTNGGVWKNPGTPWFYEGADNNGALVSLEYPEWDRIESTLATLHTTYQADSHKFDLFYGFFDNAHDSSWDADRSEDAFFSATTKNDLDSHSLELRISSNYAGPFNFVAGYARQDETEVYDEVGYTTQTELQILGILAPEDVVGNPDEYTHSDYAYTQKSDLITDAVFANVFYDITERLHLSAGVRYSWIDARFGSLCCGDDFGTLLMGRGHEDLIAGLGMIEQPPGSSEEFNPRITLNYDLNENASVYFQYATGYRPGVGNDPRAVEFGVIGETADPEYVDNYEIGFKGFFLDNRMSLAAAVFMMDYTDLQIRREAPIPIHVSSDDVIFVGYTDNAGKATVEGFEIETALRMTEHLELRAGVGYSDSYVEEYDDVSYDPPLNMPSVRPWTATVTAIYRTSVSENLDGQFRADYRAQDDAWTGLFPDEQNPGNYLPSWETLDLSVGVSSDDWSLVAYFENLLDEAFYTGQINWSFRPTAYYLPRTYGLRFSYSWGE